MSSRFYARCTHGFLYDYARLAGLATIRGGAGADTIDGGDGVDTVIYGAGATIAFNSVTSKWEVTEGTVKDVLQNVELVLIGSEASEAFVIGTAVGLGDAILALFDSDDIDGVTFASETELQYVSGSLEDVPVDSISLIGGTVTSISKVAVLANITKFKADQITAITLTAAEFKTAGTAKLAAFEDGSATEGVTISDAVTDADEVAFVIAAANLAKVKDDGITAITLSDTEFGGVVSAAALNTALANGALTVAGADTGVTIDAATFTKALVLNGGDGVDIITGGDGNDTITGGAGADIINISASAAVRDTIIVAAGESTVTIGGEGAAGTITGYDTITGFTIGIVATEKDLLDMAGTGVAAANGANTDGTDSTLTVGGAVIDGHTIASGIITFGTDSTDVAGNAVTVNSAASLAAVVQYLLANDFGNAGATVAFAADSVLAGTFVYRQAAGGAGGDIVHLVGLIGVTARETTASNTDNAFFIDPPPSP